MNKQKIIDRLNQCIKQCEDMVDGRYTGFTNRAIECEMGGYKLIKREIEGGAFDDGYLTEKEEKMLVELKQKIKEHKIKELREIVAQLEERIEYIETFLVL
jgi:hypothetical protein